MPPFFRKASRMSNTKMGRRDATRRVLTVLGAAALGSTGLVACGGDEETGELTCTSTSGLGAAGVATRESQSYTDTASNPEEDCEGCRFYDAGQEGRCGTCQVVQGPIHPNGTCNLWAGRG